MNSNKLKQVQNVCSYIDGEFITKYHPVKMLSSGSYGTTFLVEYQGKRYVVKNQDYDKFIDLSILTEVNVLITLKNIPEVIGFEGVCYPRKQNAIMVVLEAMDGDISSISNRKDFDNIYLTEQLLQQITRSLAVFQDNSLIHYDVKPKNLLYKISTTEQLFSTEFTSEIVIRGIRPNILFKLADFSLTKSKIPKLTTETLFSPIYKPPEYFEFLVNTDIKTNPYAADVWSFGVTIIEFLIGEFLFYGEDEETTLQLILDNSIIVSNGSESEEESEDIYLDEFIETYHEQQPRYYVNVERILTIKLEEQDFNRIPKKLISLLSDMLHLHPKYRPSAKDILKNYFHEEVDSNLLEQQINKQFSRKTDISVEVISKSIIYYLMHTVFADGDKDRTMFTRKMSITIVIALEIYTRFLYYHSLENKLDSVLYPIAALLIAKNYTDIKISLFNYFNTLYPAAKLPGYSKQNLDKFVANYPVQTASYDRKVHSYLKTLFDSELAFAQKIMLKKIQFVTFIPTLNVAIKKMFENKINVSSIAYQNLEKDVVEWWD